MTDDATLSDFFGDESGDEDGDGSLEERSADGPESTGEGRDEPGSAGESRDGPESTEPDAERSASGSAESVDGAGSDDTGGGVASAGQESIGRESSDSGLSTYAWGEYTCDRCDGETERVWREEGALVCPDCKSW